jgi:hypothetical protein
MGNIQFARNVACVRNVGMPRIAELSTQRRRREVSEKKCAQKAWDRDAINYLLRFGRKNSGPWDDTAGVDKNGRELVMPDDGDTDLVTAAPELYEALDNLLTRLSYDKDAKAWFPEEQERARCALRKARGEYE